jgi:putative endonuclease
MVAGSPYHSIGCPARKAAQLLLIIMHMFYVYILLLNNKQLYTGSTNDLKRRYKEHKNGKVKSTQYRRPLELLHYEAYLKKSDAVRREGFLKTTEGKRLIKQQLRDILIEKGLLKSNF